MAKSVDLQNRLPKAALEKALSEVGDAKLVDLKRRIADGEPKQPFLAKVKDEVQRSGVSASKVSISKLREIASRELLALQSAAKRGEQVDLEAVKANFGSFAQRLLSHLHTQHFGRRDTRPKVVNRTAYIESPGPSPKVGKGLRPFTAYFPEHAGKLPGDLGKRLPHGFTVAHARWFHREYWGAPPYADFQDILDKAQKDPLFRGHGKVELWQAQNLFKEYPDSFPWRWPTRNAIFGSYSFVKAMLEAPKGSSRGQVVSALRQENDRFPDATAFNNYMSGPWRKEPRLYPFLEGLPKDASGRVILEAQGDLNPWQPDGGGRLALTQALADDLKRLTGAPAVRWDWSPEDFVRFVRAETGCEGFLWATFLNCRKKFGEDFPTWPEVQSAAQRRMALEIRALQDEARDRQQPLSRGALVERLNAGLSPDDRPWTENQIETVQRNFSDIVQGFIAQRKDTTEAEALQLLEAIRAAKERDPKISQFAVAKKLGLTEMRAKHLLRVAATLEPTAFDQRDGDYNRFDAQDDAMLRKAMERLPIGEDPTALYRLMEQEFPRYVERHPLREPKRISKTVQKRLNLGEDWVTHQQTRLAKLLAQVTAEMPEGTSFRDIIRAARAQHPIKHSDEVVQNSPYRWKREPQKYPEITKLLDAHGRFPWEGLRSAPHAEVLKRFAASFQESQPWAGEARYNLSAEQTRTLHELYWSAPPHWELTDLMEAAKQRPAFEGAAHLLEPFRVNKLFNENRDRFPWDMRGRGFAIHSLLFAEALAQSPETVALAQLEAQLAERWPGFPSVNTFARAARGTWLQDPGRFPFLAQHLPRAKDRWVLRGQKEVQGFKTQGSRLVLSVELARATGELLRSDRIRYDWDARQLNQFLSDALGVPFSDQTLTQMRRKPELRAHLPSYEDIRKTARLNFVTLIKKLHVERGLDTPDQIFDTLHKEFGFPRYENNRMGTLRQEFGPELVPNFREAMAQKTLEQCEALFRAIKQAKGKKGIYEIGLELGYSFPELTYRLELIHRTWPDALPGLNPTNPYTKADKAALRAAMEHSAIGAHFSEVAQILRREHPEFYDRHALVHDASLLQVAKRELGLDSWPKFHDERFAQLVADIVARAPDGFSLAELYRVLVDEYDVRYSEQRVRDRLAQWKTDPAGPPAIRKLIDKNGKYPWELRTVTLTPELAQDVGAVMRAHPEESLAEIVVRLHKDPEFTAAYPGFAVQHIINLRAAFGDELVPYAREIRRHGEVRSKQLQVTSRLIERIAKEVDRLGSTDGLTAGFLAERLGVEVHELNRALQKAGSRFPWSGFGSGGDIDILLAAHVGHLIEQAPLGTTPEMIVAQLKADPEFAAAYPDFSGATLPRLREAYPHVVPDLAEREQILRAQTMVNAVLTSPKGTPFETIRDRLERQHPGHFPPEPAEAYVQRWASAPVPLGFIDALRTKSGFDLRGRGGAGLVEAKMRSNASRLAREIPQIPADQPVLRRLVEGMGKGRFQDAEFVCVQHMLGVQVPFYDICEGIGMNRGRTTIIGTPYTSNRTVRDVLRDKGWDARRVPLDLAVWKEEVRSAVYERLRSAMESGRRVVVLDDGGIVSKLIAEDPFLRDHADKFTVVEQTRRGITVAEENPLRTALTNVAQSLTKVLVEGPIIGDILQEKLMTRLERLGIKSVKGMRIGVIGKGAIGNPLIEELRRMGAIVTGWDTDRDKLTEAEKKLTEAEFFGGQELILGATGMESMGPEQLAHIKSGAVIGSCSSKLVEIDMGHVSDSAAKGGVREVDAESFPPSVEYTLKDGRKITVLAQGYPLNFDGAVNTTDPDLIQVTRALLLLGLLQASRSKVPEIHRLDIEGQLNILRYFAELPKVKADPLLRAEVDKTMALIEKELAGGGKTDPRPPKRAPVPGK